MKERGHDFGAVSHSLTSSGEPMFPPGWKIDGRTGPYFAY